MMQCTKVSKATHIDICHFATLPEMEKWKEEEEGGGANASYRNAVDRFWEWNQKRQNFTRSLIKEEEGGEREERKDF